jgi:GT2 family glycosyltransferase
MHVAQQLLQAGPQEPLRADFLNLGVDILFAAWTKDPLDGQIAGQLLALDEKWPRLDRESQNMLREVTRTWCRPEDIRYYQRLVESRDTHRLRRFLSTQAAKEPDNLYWRQQMLGLGLYEGDADLVSTVLRQNWSDILEPCRRLIAGDAAWLAGERKTAASAYARALGPDACGRRARWLWDEGRRDEARHIWRDTLSRTPWLTGKVLRLFDMLEKENRRPKMPAGNGVVALYSFNKAEELDATLESLFASDGGGQAVRVLDNGSTDRTAQVLAAWCERVGERLRIISLHVNIGAPAARNWLMHDPEIREYSWMAYLDDDVELPADWLGRLGAAMHCYPDAGVWGCKVVDHARPVVLQSVDLHLMPPFSEEEGRRFKVSDLHHQTLDFGQFDYIRPCASVTGCCHLFRMDRLQESGGFDLRFSPSQYDDLEHDIRLNLAGRYAVYQGFLAVRHKKRTGKSSRVSTAEFGNSLGNLHKLQKKYSAQEYAQIMAWEEEVLNADFSSKARRVAQWLNREEE